MLSWFSASLVPFVEEYFKQPSSASYLKPIEVVNTINKEINRSKDDLTNKVNGGVILFNVQQILADNKAKVLTDIAMKYKNVLQYIDEDSIAIAFKYRIKPLEYYYNYMPMWQLDYDNLSSTEKNTYKSRLHNIIIYHYINQTPHKLSKLYKITTYKEFYKYFQMSYLKINPIKLQFIFWLNQLKALRRKTFGTKELSNKNRIFYIGKWQFNTRKRSVKAGN